MLVFPFVAVVLLLLVVVLLLLVVVVVGVRVVLLVGVGVVVMARPHLHLDHHPLALRVILHRPGRLLSLRLPPPPPCRPNLLSCPPSSHLPSPLPLRRSRRDRQQLRCRRRTASRSEAPI
jgi:hypothetical protein